MYVTTEITIDFLRPRKNIMEVVQDDTTRKIRLVIKSGGNDFNVSADLASGDSVVGAVAYLKSDGHGGVYDTTPDGDTAVQLVSGTVNQFDVMLVGQVFTAAGWTQVNIKFYNSDFSKVLSTFAINVHVQRNAASDYESEDYSNMESLGAIRAEMVAFEATVRDELAAFATNPEFEYVTVKDQTGGVTLAGGYIGTEPVLELTETGDDDRPIRVMNVATPTLGTDAANKAFVIANGISEDVKEALLDCFAHVAWVNEHGQDYYDALEAALYPSADLVSISAVFNQGQTVVYDTDSLDVLKPMLTVTAHYSDSSTGTVTAYTLSGTLTAGTSTITVLYGDKTTTFTVAVTAYWDFEWDFTQGKLEEQTGWESSVTGTASSTITANGESFSTGNTASNYMVVRPQESNRLRTMENGLGAIEVTFLGQITSGNQNHFEIRAVATSTKRIGLMLPVINNVPLIKVEDGNYDTSTTVAEFVNNVETTLTIKIKETGADVYLNGEKKLSDFSTSTSLYGTYNGLLAIGLGTNSLTVKSLKLKVGGV